MGQGVFVTCPALRLTPEYLWFLFISLKEIRKKETSEATSCLPEFKEWQCFRDNMGLRNSRRMAEELWWWYIYIAPCSFAEHFPTAVWLDFSQYPAREGERGRCLWLSLFDERESWASEGCVRSSRPGRPGPWQIWPLTALYLTSTSELFCDILSLLSSVHFCRLSLPLIFHMVACPCCMYVRVHKNSCKKGRKRNSGTIPKSL